MTTDKELYPIFEVDVCIQSYATDYALIGAADLEDLFQHLMPILKELNIPYQERRNLMKDYRTWNPKQIEGAYTDRPYEILSRFSYYE